MTIVKLDKVTLYGRATERERVLDGLQSLGCLHLVNLNDEQRPQKLESPVRSEAHQALKYLRNCRTQRRQTHHRRGYDFQKITHQVLNIQHREQELNDGRDELLQAIAEREPWGEFEMPSADEIGGLRLWFFVLREKHLPQLNRADFLWKKIMERDQSVYVVVIADQRPDDIPTSPLSLDPRSLAELRERLEEAEEQIEELHWQRVALTRWSDVIAQDLDAADDEAVRRSALEAALTDDRVFALRGWVPRDTTDELKRYAEQNRLAVTVEPPAVGDRPPTLLKNPDSIAGAEGAVTFYITPDYRAWDPTPVVYFSFALFFAMIMSDAGYGILLGLLLVPFWRKLSRTQRHRGFRNLLVAIVVATVGYGILIGSYFGINPAEGTLFDRLQLKLDGRPIAADRDVMMTLSVVIGVFHLSLANLVTAWGMRRHSQSLAALGWIGVLIGGLMVGGAMMPDNPLMLAVAEALQIDSAALAAKLRPIGEIAVFAGAASVFLFSSSRPLFSVRPSDWVWRILHGAQGLTGFSKAFGDVLSYLRLFALGLASAQLATTFNELAGGASQIRGPGVLLAVLILVIGHGINILLAIMGGVVHGLRLNCIEFFNWSLTAEGYPFRAFCKKATE